VEVVVERIVSATQARIHFGELIQQVVNEQAPVVVERAGKPQVVIISVDQYERLKAGQERQVAWRDWVRRAREQIAGELGDRQLIPAEEIIRQMREDRDEQLLDLR
jgi:prevent-host-death family protein